MFFWSCWIGLELIHCVQVYNWANGSSKTHHCDWLVRLTLDDQLFYQSLVSLHCLNEVHRGQVQPYSEHAILHLICQGLVDHEERDYPFDASTCAMCYSVVLSDCLWEMVLRERTSLIFYKCPGSPSTPACFGLLIWPPSACEVSVSMVTLSDL